MKIIATMENYKHLCELTSDELRKLAPSANIAIGTEYDLVRAFDTLETLRKLSTRHLSDVDTAIGKLHTQFAQVQDNYNKLMLLDTVKHSTEETK